MNIKLIEISRLKGRQMLPFDLPYLAEMNQNPRVMKFMGGIRNSKATKEKLAGDIEHWKSNGFGLWMLFTKKDNSFVGRGGLKIFELEGNKEIEIAYALNPKFWNLGFATELTLKCKELTFSTLKN